MRQFSQINKIENYSNHLNPESLFSHTIGNKDNKLSRSVLLTRHVHVPFEKHRYCELANRNKEL
jgi:hypothetical protein